MIYLYSSKPKTLLVATAILLLGVNASWATSYPITPNQRATAEKTARAGVPLSELADNAPDSYTIKSGDTLWAISGIFLKRPWRWPELWGMNKDQIRNPHLIYPGQVLVLTKSPDGRATLRVAEAVGSSASNGTVKLSPRVRADTTRLAAIPSIPAKIIEPFLSRPLIVDVNGLQNAPRVVATQENRLYTSSNDTLYVRGIPPGDDTLKYDVFRPGTPLKDPDTQTVIAYEAEFLGNVERTAVGDPATFRVLKAKEEIGVGDRLVPTPKVEMTNYVPHELDKKLEGRVLSIYGGGVEQAASGMIISLNRGSDQGLERGHVLRLMRSGETMVDRTSPIRNEQITLPDHPYGYVLVFRVFNKVSYGLVVGTTAPVIVGDRFSSTLD